MCVFDGNMLHSSLQAMDMRFLYHSNTMPTAQSFFKAQGLLSRGALEDYGLYQTEQKTDSKDKKLDLWYDVFFDSCDIHKESKRINYYGPVCFVFSTEILKYYTSVKITKRNPLYWSSNNASEYLSDLREKRKFDFGQHITIGDLHQPIPFKPFLTHIILDNPNISDKSYFNKAKCYIDNQIKNNSLNCDFIVRKCPVSCKCKSLYGADLENTYDKFALR